MAIPRDSNKNVLPVGLVRVSKIEDTPPPPPVSDGGGTDALSYQALDGTLEHGSKVRIATDGTYDFTTKPESAPVLHDFGHTTYERGVENTFNSELEDGVDPDTLSTNNIYSTVVTGSLNSDASLQRHEHAQRFYRLTGNHGSLREPLEYERNGREVGNRELYMGAWVRYRDEEIHNRMVSDYNTTGTFIDRELLSINDGEFTGRYICNLGEPYTFTHYMRLNIDGSTPSASDLYGKVLVGTESGATLTFPSESEWVNTNWGPNDGYPFIRERAGKLGRFWDNPDGGVDGQLRCSMAVDDSYLVIGSINHKNNVDQSEGWHFIELEFDLREDGFWRHAVDGSILVEESFTGPVGDPSFSPTVSQFGNDGENENQITDISEMYFDYTRHRVYLGDAPSYSECTVRELQRIDVWEQDNVEFYLNLGQLSGDKWVYVVDATGFVVNEQGLKLTP